MADSFRFWSVFFLITGAILAIGWNEPLRYRFMSRQEIEDELRPQTIATPTPEAAKAATPQWMWDPDRKTKLDEGAHNPLQSGSPHQQTTTAFTTPSPR